MYTRHKKSLVVLICCCIFSITFYCLSTRGSVKVIRYTPRSIAEDNSSIRPSFFPDKGSVISGLFRESVTPPPLENRHVALGSNDGKAKILLFWNSFAGKPSWRGATGLERFEKCPYKNCRAETDKKYAATADFILFSGVGKVAEFPPVRHPHQIYGIYVGESPSNNHRMKRFNFRMNLTATERLDSDVVCRHRFEPTEVKVEGAYRPRIHFSNKTRSVAWMVSNCNARSNRRKYVDVLAKFIDVDIYGGCGNLQCPRGVHSGSNPCFKKLETEYLFYLSFENSICKDYVTEKMYLPLQHEIVPIVLGGGNYDVVAPPTSVIDVRDFRSPRQLAEYLHYLSHHEEAYLEYFRWKNSLKFVHYDFMCEFCKIMTEGTFQRTAETWDVAEWYEKGACDNTLVDKLLQNL